MGSFRRPSLALAVLVALHVALTFRYHVPLDDAFISFRYAANLARGEGLVWNPGERVEGYTNFLWTVALAPAIAAGLDPVGPATALGTLASCAVVVLAFALARALGAGAGASVATAAAAALHVPLAFAAGSGLETAAFAAATALALVLAVRFVEGTGSPAGAGLAVGAAFLLRPEGAIAFAVAFACALARPATRARSWVLAAAFLAVAVPYEVWRIAYYGDLVPNTARAKVGFTLGLLVRGGHYLRDWLVLSGGAALLAVPFALRAGRPGRWLVLAQAVAFGACVAYVGGDALPMLRFLVPVFPWLAALAAVGLEEALPEGRRRLLAGVIALVGVLLPGLGEQPLSPWLLAEDKRTDIQGLRAIGRFLAAALPPGTTIATGVIGAIGYDSRLPLIDTFGLTDRHIARTAAPLGTGPWTGHEKGDGAYVLDRAPAAILPTFTLTFTETPWSELPPRVFGPRFFTKTERELWAAPAFHAAYRMTSIPAPPGPDGRPRWFNYYRRVEAVR